MENLNHLYTFYIVARSGGFTKAAKTLHLTQSAISHSLRTLEEGMETKLIDRGKGIFQLTKSGKLLLQTCQNIFGDYDICKEQIRQLEDRIEGDITIGCHVHIGTLWMAKQLPKLKRLYPNLRVHLSLNAENQFLIDELLAFKTDLVLIMEQFLSPKHHNVVIEKAGDATFLMFASPQYIKRTSHINTIKDLTKHTYLDWNDSYPLLNLLKHDLGPLQLIKFKEAIFMNNSLAIKNAVLGGLGIGILPYYSIKEELKRGQLTKILPKTAKTSVNVYLCSMSERAGSVKLQTVKKYFLAELKKLFSAAI